jgi:hypothetical protein
MSSSPFSSSPCPHTSLTSSPFSGGRRRIRPQGLRPVPGVEVRPPGRLRTLRLAGRVQLHLWVPGIFLSLHPLRYRQHPPFDLIGLACWLGTGFCCCDAPPLLGSPCQPVIRVPMSLLDRPGRQQQHRRLRQVGPAGVTKRVRAQAASGDAADEPATSR